MDKTIIKILVAVIVLMVALWVCRIISGMIISALALTASLVGVILAFVLRLGIPALIVGGIVYFLFIKDKQR